jgi:hypothetical protein
MRRRDAKAFTLLNTANGPWVKPRIANSRGRFFHPRQTLPADTETG